MTDYLHLRITGGRGYTLACSTSITGARSTAVPGYLLAPPALDGEPDNECPVCLEVARRLHRGEVLDAAPTKPDCASCGHMFASHGMGASLDGCGACSCDHYSTHEPPDPTEPMRSDIQTLVGALNYARESATYFLDCNQPDEVRRYLTEIERIGRSILALSKHI